MWRKRRRYIHPTGQAGSRGAPVASASGDAGRTASPIAAVGLAVSLAVAAPAQAIAANVDAFSYRGWQGWAYIADGAFRHCVVTGGYADGTTLSFFYDDDGFKLAVRQPGWALDEAEAYGVRVSVNPGLSGRVPAIAVGSDSLLLPMSGLDRPVTRLRRGYTLALEVDGLDRLTFDLTGTSVVLQRLIDCYAANG